MRQPLSLSAYSFLLLVFVLFWYWPAFCSFVVPLSHLLFFVIPYVNKAGIPGYFPNMPSFSYFFVVRFFVFFFVSAWFDFIAAFSSTEGLSLIHIYFRFGKSLQIVAAFYKYTPF